MDQHELGEMIARENGARDLPAYHVCCLFTRGEGKNKVCADCSAPCP